MATLSELRRKQVEIGRQLAVKAVKAKRIAKQIEQHKRQIARLERTLAGILGAAGTLVGKRPRVSPRRPGPTQKDLVRAILEDAKKPMCVKDIVAKMIAKGYRFVSQNPVNAMNVLMYTDTVHFRKTKPGFFALK